MGSTAAVPQRAAEEKTGGPWSGHPLHAIAMRTQSSAGQAMAERAGGASTWPPYRTLPEYGGSCSARVPCAGLTGCSPPCFYCRPDTSKIPGLLTTVTRTVAITVPETNGARQISRMRASTRSRSPHAPSNPPIGMTSPNSCSAELCLVSKKF